MDEKRQWYSVAAQATVTALKTDANQGLTTAEADRRLAQFGPNSLPQVRRSGVGKLVLGQFRDLMTQVLLAAAVVAAFIGEPQDAIAILVIVGLNAVIGVIQQYRAENAIAALRNLAAPNARVVRDGSYRTLPASELVPGDIVILETGAVVPADLRLLDAPQLQTDESMLTGESSAVEKTSETLAGTKLGVGDRGNMAHHSSLVTRGRGRGVVVATAMDTEIGGIAKLLSGVELLESPLQQRLNRFSKRLGIIILGICAALFLTGIARGEPWLLMLLTSVSLAVAAIPEALPAVVSISLAMGARRMSSSNALVRSLPAVETLGSVSFICADKTGTLTMNRMHVEEAISGIGSAPRLPELASAPARPWVLFGQGLALSNDVQLDASQAPAGDPTEVALFEMARAAGFDKAVLEAELPRVAEVAFTSERKQMTTVHRGSDGLLVFSKGAPEMLLECCDQVLTGQGPEAIDKTHWSNEVERLSNQGYRVLALACKPLSELPLTVTDGLEQGLMLLGIAALIDPPREGAVEAVRECQSAGITCVMITGDHPGTAGEIARRLGIARPGDQVVTGQALEKISDEELVTQVVDNRVYARVSPAQKIRLVKALQDRGQFIAMTGDGVNDAPALKQADIGVAMGLKGTDVARQAAAMVLLDDNFTTIVTAVREGRRIFDNIRKFVRYTMSSNAGEICTLALAPLFGLPLPLLPIHILWINLVTDGLPGLALTAQPEEQRIMQRPPHPPRESLFAHGMWQHILLIGLLIGGISLGVQAWALQQGHAHWQTMVFTVLTFSQLANVLVIRNEHDSLFTTGLLQNPALIGAVMLTVLLQLAVIYLPLMNTIFYTAPLSLTELGICLGLPLLVIVAVEGRKWLVRRGRNQDKRREEHV
jgi:P-type Ca2+ transporter type 2C